MGPEISGLTGELLASQVEWMFLFQLVLKKWGKNEGRCFSIILLLMVVDFENFRRVKNNIL